MINTLNETHLHRALKDLYSISSEGCLQEQKVGDFIADIVTSEGNIIEIQTASLSHLYKKISYCISHKKKITVVYPLACVKYIETKATDGSVKRKKSPKKQNIYSIFKELTKIYPFLLSRYFTLDVMETVITEERTKTEEKVQSKNKRRRFARDWNKTGKRLDEAGKVHRFHGKKSWKQLLPPGLENEFTSKEFYQAFTDNGINIKKDDAQIMLWVYSHLELIQITGKQGRSYIYSLNC